jgi:hypothetical protein
VTSVNRAAMVRVRNVPQTQHVELAESSAELNLLELRGMLISQHSSIFSGGIFLVAVVFSSVVA